MTDVEIRRSNEVQLTQLIPTLIATRFLDAMGTAISLRLFSHATFMCEVRAVMSRRARVDVIYLNCDAGAADCPTDSRGVN